MAQTGYTPISLYYSTTASTAPTAGNLVAGELAINTTDGKLYYKDTAGVVQILGTKGGVGTSSTTQVLYNSSGLVVGSANMTFDGTTLTSTFSGAHNGTVGATTPATGAFTTLSYSSTLTGGTGIVNLGSGQFYKDASGNVGIGTSSPTIARLHIAGYNGGSAYPIRMTSSFSGVEWAFETGGANAAGSFLAFRDIGNSAERMRIFASGGVSIGNTTDPGATNLSVTGKATIQTLTIGVGGGTIGTNTALGFQTLNSNTTGSLNTAVGYNGLTANTTGSSNTAVGRLSLQTNTTGSSNSSFGTNSGYTNNGSSNCFFGDSSGFNNSSGNYNVAIGASALLSNTTANDNTAVGYQAAYSNVVGTNVTAIGSGALRTSTADSNTAVGATALYANTTGASNSSLGVASLRFNTSGAYNTAFGVLALYSNTTASNNTAVGYQAGYNTTGANNTAVGYQANYSNAGAVQATSVGYLAGYSSNANSVAYFGAYAGQNTNATGNTFIGDSCGYLITTGAKNTIIGRYSGNQGSLDIRTASNYIVLSDGDGNPRQYFNGSIAIFNGTISPVQATTAAAPAYVKGAIYFDTTLNKLRVGGATAWETITSV